MLASSKSLDCGIAGRIAREVIATEPLHRDDPIRKQQLLGKGERLHLEDTTARVMYRKLRAAQ